MEGNEDPPMVPIELTYEAFTALVKSRDGQEFACPAAVLDGFDDLSLAEKQTVVDAVSFILTFSGVLRSILADAPAQAFEAFVEVARTFAPPTKVTAPMPPFTTLVRRQHLTSAQYKMSIAADNALVCTSPWGPPVGPIKNLMSPLCLLLYTWFGRTCANPILDFVFSMCSDPRAWVRVWTTNPAKYAADSNAKLDVGQQPKEALSNRTRGYGTQAKLVCHLASLALDSLEYLGEGIFMASTYLPVTTDDMQQCIVRVSPGDIASSIALQYTTLIRHDQVLTPLPTQSSLPKYEPNFVDETNAQWFRTAQYHFSSLKFPQEALERGDASAENVWHQYVCEVRHARSLCLNLSEAQVIRHLTMSFTRSAMHYQTSIEKAQTPNCTVTDWLDAIRDFFFTNGLFRHHIEQAWQTYKAGHASDFNDLVHHIRTYYQLIFLDYPKLSGDMTVQDFAWHLFEKMQYLMSHACKSSLGVTLQMYIPHSDLLKQMHLHLSQARGKSTDKASAAGVSFVIWCIEQLHVAKAAANAAQRYSSASYLPTPGVDYAALTNKPQLPDRQPWKRPKLDKQPVLNPTVPGPRISLANMSHNPGRDHNARSLQTPTAPAPPLRKPDSPQKELRDICVCGDEQRQQSYLEDHYQHPQMPQYMRDLLAYEQRHEGQPGSLAFLGRQLGRMDYFIPATAIAVGLALLKSYRFHSKPQCWICPHVRGADPATRQHAAVHCPTVAQRLRDANIDFAPIAAAMDPNKAFYAHDPATRPSAAPQPGPRGTPGPNPRKRCDSQPRHASQQPPGPPPPRSQAGPSHRSNIR